MNICSAMRFFIININSKFALNFITQYEIFNYIGRRSYKLQDG